MMKLVKKISNTSYMVILVILFVVELIINVGKMISGVDYWWILPLDILCIFIMFATLYLLIKRIQKIQRKTSGLVEELLDNSEELSASSEETAAINQQVAANVNNNNDNIQKILEVVSIIEEITDETNLLSINASIEAAKAKEQGRGFAVVADRIQNLSETTKESTSDIFKIIKKVISASDENSRSIEELAQSSQEIAEASQRNADMAERLQNILEG